jgi:hypothetical protein
MDSQSPFALLLVGQPTLARQLRLGVFAALDQRIATRYQLAPMDLAEAAQYLRHHLALVGRTDPLFADDAIAWLHKVSLGLPRALNNGSPPTNSMPYLWLSSVGEARSGAGRCGIPQQDAHLRLSPHPAFQCCIPRLSAHYVSDRIAVPIAATGSLSRAVGRGLDGQHRGASSITQPLTQHAEIAG